MSTTVSYKGNTIATVTNSTATLQTQGKYLEADIILTDSSQASPTIDPLTVTPTTSQQTFNSGSVDGYKPVTVNAMPTGTAGTPTATKGAVSNYGVDITPSVTNSTGYINGGTVSGTPVHVDASELVSGSQTVSRNGAVDVTNLAEVIVSVPATVPTIQSLTVTPSTSQQTFDSSFVDGYKPVVVDAMPSGTAGTPTATKGAVSNHSVSVTPSVTNSTGYIAGGTKTGTAVTVSASELVSGSETKTVNGTYDVTNLAEVVVDVPAGPTNMVTGTFTPGTTGTVESLTIPYTGSGHPIMCAIFPADGSYKSSTAIYSLVQQYAVVEWWMSKANTAVSPTYTTSGGANYGCTAWVYKSSASSATTYSRSSAMTTNTYSSSNAAADGATCVRFSSDTTLKYFVASTSYGLVSGTEYRYVILYSS